MIAASARMMGSNLPDNLRPNVFFFSCGRGKAKECGGPRLLSPFIAALKSLA